MTGSEKPCASAGCFSFHLRPGLGSGNEPAGHGTVAGFPSGSPVSFPQLLGLASCLSLQSAAPQLDLNSAGLVLLLGIEGVPVLFTSQTTIVQSGLF